MRAVIPVMWIFLTYSEHTSNS
ncbi:hypothetical protein MAR_025017 [Mya arenaria]|uniref:Uncharacterized protein n=1 Tax=Mya arenaria TaxID=6604 RepID=A0ABY7DT94_MYAAR|nr:hypothetical protein MAR_025017 [Mya arenaria]